MATTGIHSIEENSIEENSIEQKKSPQKLSHGEFQNVLLTEKEYNQLIENLNPDAVSTLIEELSGYVESTGKKYKSHYATLQNWARRRINDHVKSIKNTKLKMI